MSPCVTDAKEACSEPVGLRDGVGMLESKKRGSWSRQKEWYKLKYSPELARTFVCSFFLLFTHLFTPPKCFINPCSVPGTVPAFKKKCNEKAQFIKLWGKQKNGKILQVRKALPGKEWSMVGTLSRQEGRVRVGEEETQKDKGVTLEMGCTGMGGMARSVSSMKFQREKEPGFLG